MALTAEDVGRYRAEGYLAPIPVLSSAERAAARADVDALMRRTGGLADPGSRHKPHLYSRWVSDLVRHPAILDPVESLLGPDLLVWRSSFFVKPPRDPRYVAWHQDSVYWGLSSEEVVTAWIALTESTIENGCLRVVAGSHLRPEVPHAVGTAEDNVLVRGQKAEIDVPDADATPLELRPGEMSLHHVRMLHGSGANASDGYRIGLAVRYIAPSVQERGGRRSATLVRGEDRYGNYEHEPAPRADGDPEALVWHRRSSRRYAADLVRESLRKFPSNLGIFRRWIGRPARFARAIRSLWRRPSGN